MNKKKKTKLIEEKHLTSKDTELKTDTISEPIKESRESLDSGEKHLQNSLPVEIKKKKKKKKKSKHIEEKTLTSEDTELTKDTISEPIGKSKESLDSGENMPTENDSIIVEKKTALSDSDRITYQLKKDRNKFQNKLNKKLQGGQFRWINEQLYTSESSKAVEMFEDSPEMFQVYHEGFKSQVNSWPQNPVDLMTKFLKSSSPSLVVADIGCGEAKIAECVDQKVHSFDLVAVNDRVTVADMAKLPLADGSVDIAIFCLALMGVNVSQFIQEAFRILKSGGTLKIAEVVSRFKDMKKFTAQVSQFGFELKSMNDSNTMFVLMDFSKSCKASRNKGNKSSKKNSKGTTEEIRLNPCIYKRR